MSLLATSRLIPGVRVRRNDELYLVVDLLSPTEVLVESEGGHRVEFSASELLPDIDQPGDESPDLVNVDDRQWVRALEIYALIEPVINMPGTRTRSDVAGIAKKANKHISTIYRWVNDYEETGLISSLIRRSRNDRGVKRLDKSVEEIINNVIEDEYLTEQRKSISKICEVVEKKCKGKALKPPDPSTIRARIYEISEERRLRKRVSNKAADERFLPIRGSFPGANFPLAVMQIDHTPFDVIIVDDVDRLPIGRAYLTSAIDVYSKMAPGFYISMDHPGGFATGMCISTAILGKEALLSRLGLDYLEWPCWGVMRTIHTDNAKEFRGSLLGKAALQYGIIIEHRPKGRPNYGGHIERSFRTFMKEVHNELPGTTFSNVKERIDYDSDGKAVMTFDALEKWFTIFLLGVYHQKPHSGNEGLPPIAKWNEGIYGSKESLGSGIPMRVPDENKLRLDFMPYFERTVQEYGIRFDGITYWTDALRRFIHMKDPASRKLKKMFICRYDPRDLSKIWMYDPETKQYIEIPYRDLTRPAISLWELRAAKKKLKAKSLSVTNEELIFKSVDEMRKIVNEESKKTKKARRERQKMKQRRTAPAAVKGSSDLPEKSKSVNEVEEADEIFEPYVGIRESEQYD